MGLPPATSLATRLAEESGRLGRTMQLRIQVRSFDAICRMVAATGGVGILPRLAAEPHARSMPIRLIALADDWASRRLLLGVRDADALPVPARLLLAHLRGRSRGGREASARQGAAALAVERDANPSAVARGQRADTPVARSSRSGNAPSRIVHSSGPPAWRTLPSIITSIRREGDMAGQILAGIRVLELGQLIAGPSPPRRWRTLARRSSRSSRPARAIPCASGACCTRARPCGGKPSRATSNRCVDLRQPEGQDIVRLLAREADVLIENFRPGTLEKWGLSWEALHALNPRLIMLRVSGYGQTGPKAREGFAAIGEAMAGLRYLNGEPGRAPVRAGLSLATPSPACTARWACCWRCTSATRGGQGQVIDAALYESLFNLSESLLPEYSVFGAVREPAGAALPGIAPSNAYPCRDGYVLIAGNGDAIYVRLMARIGRDDLGRDPDLAHNDGRARRVAEIDGAIGDWTRARSIDEVLAAMREADVPSGRIYSVADIARDPHYRAREAITTVRAASGIAVDMPAVFSLSVRQPRRRGNARPRWASTPTPCLSQEQRDALRARGDRMKGGARRTRAIIAASVLVSRRGTTPRAGVVQW